ncbi:putative transposase [Burkholderia pseudomallei]|nr:hypothetical protein BBK_1116 [Burkholderia pseudomallei NCTC 13179]MBF3557795.1 transposase [Burkholderia pseudomallei]MPT65355.1 transposase [Burkholderia pseudomallei]MPT71753.1 transposase [Burkholderia pseudomallei]MPT86890.1 transposase [Burkholderia pseudomallei]
MAKPIPNSELWPIAEPLLPMPKPHRARYPGRKPLDDRAVLTGILFVLQSGIPWEMLPQAIRCASGMSCRRRLRHRQQVGVWDRVHEVFLAKRRAADRIVWSRVVIDSSAIRGMACRRSPPVGERSARAQARGSDHERRWCEPTHEIRQRRDRAMQRHATHGSPRGTCAAVSQPLAIANAMMLRSPLSPFFVQPCPSHFIRVRCRCPSRSRRARAWPG